MVISIASQKGGTGKTSTSISLAAGLAHKGKRVLLVDIDSQANSSKVLLHDYPKIAKEQTIYATILGPLVIHDTHVPNLSIIPSHILLSNADVELTTAKDHRESRLKTELDKIKGTYDYVFIDNPPAFRLAHPQLVHRKRPGAGRRVPWVLRAGQSGAAGEDAGGGAGVLQPGSVPPGLPVHDE